MPLYVAQLASLVGGAALHDNVQRLLDNRSIEIANCRGTQIFRLSAGMSLLPFDLLLVFHPSKAAVDKVEVAFNAATCTFDFERPTDTMIR